MKMIKTFLLSLLLILIITFSIKNAGYVSIRYFGLTDEFEIPLFFPVLLSLSLGMFAGVILDLTRRHQLRRAIRRQQKLMGELQKERWFLMTGTSAGSTTGRG
jgi:uncharacterized integral membrane protein